MGTARTDAPEAKAPAKAQKSKKSAKAGFGRPPRWLYDPAFLVMALVYRLKYGTTVDRSGLKDLKGPALVLAPHISGKDHVLLGLALFPHRPTFVLSTHFMANPKLRPILKIMRVITKKMFNADVGTIMNIMRAKRSGNVIVLFPEGRLTWFGHSGAITAGTADLVRKLNVPVYTVVGNGSYLMFPKWGQVRRGGKIRVTTEKLLTPEQIADMTSEQIHEYLTEKLRHDEEAAMAGVRYPARDTTDGLDGILYRCPVCGKEKTLVAGGNHIRCTDCGFDTELDETYRFTSGPVKSVNQWYDWQLAQLAPDTVIDTPVVLGSTNEKDNMTAGVGHGQMHFDREAMTIRGTLFGRPLELTIPTSRLVALPLTVNEHFDVYDGERLIYVYPEDPRDVVRCADLCEAARAAGEAGA